jgi:pimeloyl-ACP methyl ester carboxylesterase
MRYIQTTSRKVALSSLLFLSVVFAAGQQGPTSPPRAPGKLIDIGGYRLHLNCVGNKGPSVILINGAGDFSFDWSLVQPAIGQFARVCSYDRAGFAWSDPGPIPRTMKQEAFELHTLLNAAHVKGPYVMVGHSLGGLVARVYASQYPREVAGVVLVDSTHEDTTLMLNNKLVHMREIARPDPVPVVQTMKSGPPKAVTKEEIDRFQSDLKASGGPRIGTPYDKLPASAQALRLYFLSQPPRGGGGMDFLAEELRDMYAERAKKPYELGNIPLVVVLPRAAFGKPPRGIDADEWKRVNEEKRQQKIDFINLSHNSKLVDAPNSGHHIQLDEPQVVIDAVRMVVESSRRHQSLDGKKL